MAHAHPERDEWRRDVVEYVLEKLPPPPVRLLDVGCGDGWLVHELVERGYDALGIDPEATEDDALLRRARLEDLDPDEPFDVVTAILSLHHVDDLDDVVARIGKLTAPDGTVLCIEFAWERFDDATARWCLERLPADLDEHNWLHETCRPLRERQRGGGDLRAAEVMHDWANEHDFHSATRILEQLRREFGEKSIAWGPYLYPELGIDPGEERGAVERGQIAPMSFRFVSTPRASRSGLDPSAS